MILKRLEQLKKEVDKLYSNYKKIAEEAPKCKLDGFELALLHLMSDIETTNKILLGKIYQKEYRDEE